MIECHSMIGEGQLNFLPSHILKLDDTKYGLICTRLVFDQEAKEQVESIGVGEFYSYLEKKTVNDKSYLDYLYPGVKDSKKFLLVYNYIKDKSKEEGILVDGKELPDFKEWKIDLSQENGHAIIAIKSQSIDVTKPPRQVYKECLQELEKHFEILDKVELDPYEKYHLFVVMKSKK